MTRTFKVRGEDTFGVELGRNGDLVTLRTHSPGWPFPGHGTFNRARLVWMAGNPELAPEPAREEPLEAPGPADTTGSLFEHPSLEGGEGGSIQLAARPRP